MKKLSLLACLMGALLAAADCASINYSGRLVPVNGRAFNGQTPVTMTFRIYDRATGGTPLWGRRYPVIIATDGSFATVLTSSEGVAVNDATYADLGDALAQSDRIYIGLTPVDVDGTTAREITPRQQLATMPRAEVAARAKSVARTTVRELTVDGALTASGPLTANVLTVLAEGENALTEVTYKPEGTQSVLVAPSNTVLACGDRFFRSTKDTSYRSYISTSKVTALAFGATSTWTCPNYTESCPLKWDFPNSQNPDYSRWGTYLVVPGGFFDRDTQGLNRLYQIEWLGATY